VVSLTGRTAGFAILLAAIACATAASASDPAKLHVGVRAEFLVSGAGSLWATDSVLNRVVRIDPAAGRVIARIRIRPLGPLGIAYGAGSVWVGNRSGGSVTRISPKTNKPKANIRVGVGPYAVAYGAGSAWATNEISGTVSRINPRKNRVSRTIKVGGGPNGIVVAFGSVWVADYGRGRLLRINPAKNRVTGRIDLPHADWITPSSDALWVSSESNKVYRVDPSSMHVLATVAVGSNPLASAIVGDELWVPNIDSNTVSVVDLGTAGVRRTLEVGHSPIAIAQAGGSVWVTAEADGDVWRLSPSG
jgi:YVTN family beta-propeller protein